MHPSAGDKMARAMYKYNSHSGEQQERNSQLQGYGYKCIFPEASREGLDEARRQMAGYLQ
jgi:hypothetical protein